MECAQKTYTTDPDRVIDWQDRYALETSNLPESFDQQKILEQLLRLPERPIMRPPGTEYLII
jgi:hypothetical protein